MPDEPADDFNDRFWENPAEAVRAEIRRTRAAEPSEAEVFERNRQDFIESVVASSPSLRDHGALVDTVFAAHLDGDLGGLSVADAQRRLRELAEQEIRQREGLHDKTSARDADSVTRGASILRERNAGRRGYVLDAAGEYVRPPAKAPAATAEPEIEFQSLGGLIHSRREQRRRRA